jgi:cobalt/nickel transport system permease protein
MHISEGVMSPAVLGSAAMLTAGGTWLGLRRLDSGRIPTAAVLTAAFFLGSLVHVPVGPSSVHLLFNGLAGVMLGWVAFPCMLVALFLQAVIFQFGGLTVLGVNTLAVAAPAVCCHYALRGLVVRGGGQAALGGFLAGAGAVLGTSGVAALCLVATEAGFLAASELLVAAHLPAMVAEGVVSMVAVGFLARVRPGLLAGACPVSGQGA